MTGAGSAKPISLSAPEAQRLRKALEAVWEAMTGKEPEHLGRDLAVLERWFGPATDKMVRAALDSMGLAPRGVAWLPDEVPELVVEVDGILVVTPEGRIALRELTVASSLTPVSIYPQNSSELREVYREWAFGKLNAAAARQSGRGSALNPVAIASVAVLLLHGATSRETALTIPRDSDIELDTSLRAPLVAFRAWSKDPSNVKTRVRSEKFRFQDHPIKQAREKFRFQDHPIKQARERLGGQRVCRGNQADTTVLWVEDLDDRTPSLLEVLAQETRRKMSDLARARAAFTALVETYLDTTLPVLTDRELGPAVSVDPDGLTDRIYSHLRAVFQLD